MSGASERRHGGSVSGAATGDTVASSRALESGTGMQGGVPLLARKFF